MTVITGGHDILVLESRQIYLDNSRLPVPKYTWKIVQDGATRQAIALVTSNNPFANDGLLCPDIIQSTGWYQNSYTDVYKGLTFACDVNTLRNVIRTIPEIHYNSVLYGPFDIIRTDLKRKKRNNI